MIHEIDAAIRLIMLGDYIDRGPDSAGVLRLLHGMCQRGDGGIACLMGNHEAMLLDFLDDPQANGPGWLRNGGTQTLASLGVAPPSSEAESLATACRDLRAALGPDLIAWLRGLPLLWQSGNVVACHAGGDPRQPFEARRGHGLLWGHRDFFRRPRSDGLWVVHGHFMVPEPMVKEGRISIDTGAWRSGMLTAAIIDGPEIRFLSTPGQ